MMLTILRRLITETVLTALQVLIIQEEIYLNRNFLKLDNFCFIVVAKAISTGLIAETLAIIRSTSCVVTLACRSAAFCYSFPKEGTSRKVTEEFLEVPLIFLSN